MYDPNTSEVQGNVIHRPVCPSSLFCYVFLSWGYNGEQGKEGTLLDLICSGPFKIFIKISQVKITAVAEKQKGQ